MSNKIELVNALIQVGRVRAEMNPLTTAIANLRAHEREELFRVLADGGNCVGDDVESLSHATAKLIATGSQ